jgi:hypothetical protein
MRPRPFRIGPADDNELLAVQRFGFAPQPAVSRRVGRIDRLGDQASKPSLPACSRMSSPSPVSWPLYRRPGLFATSGSSSPLRSRAES